MKTKFLQFALVAFTALSIISCSNDDDNKSEQLNSVTVDGKTESIISAYTQIGNEENYIYIGLDTFKGEDKTKDGDTVSFFGFEVPFDRIGEKIQLVENEYETLFHDVRIYKVTSIKNMESETIFSFDSYDTGYLEGTNNWVQFTAVDKAKNIYRVDFEFTAKGKVFKGNYTTEFDVFN